MTFTHQPATLQTHTKHQRHQGKDWYKHRTTLLPLVRVEVGPRLPQQAHGAQRVPKGTAREAAHTHPHIVTRFRFFLPGALLPVPGSPGEPVEQGLPLLGFLPAQDHSRERRRNSLPWLPARHLLGPWPKLVLSVLSHSMPTSAPPLTTVTHQVDQAVCFMQSL